MSAFYKDDDEKMQISEKLNISKVSVKHYFNFLDSFIFCSQNIGIPILHTVLILYLFHFVAISLVFFVTF